MTIQRQYILPNCSLVLDGMSADASNVLSILANAEFKIVGLEQPLAGGSEFFKALADAVSAYCQRLLSGMDHPDHMMVSQASLVAVEPDEGQYHRLLIKPDVLENLSEKSEKSDSQTIRLSTVQLFDMAEAIDQFNADAQTLPNFSVNLAPLSRRYVRADEPLAQRAVPPLLGFGTLAVAAIGLFFLPVPELIEPEELEQQTTSALEELADGATTDGSDDTAEAIETTADDTAVETTEPVAPVNTAITDSTQLTTLKQQVKQQISGALSEDATFESPLRYQVSVAENGDIVGYNPLDGTALESIDNTPLAALTYIPVDNANVGPTAQFDVTFIPDGTVEVVSDQIVTPEAITPDIEAPESVTPINSEEDELSNPKEDESGTEPSSTDEPSSTTGQTNAATTAESDVKTDSAPSNLAAFVTTPIQDADLIYELNQELRRTLINNRESDWTGGSAISYRIRLDEEGNITGYEADNSAAEDYAAALKIPSLMKTVPAEKPQLDFLVVINDANILEVNPWDGWPLD